MTDKLNYTRTFQAKLQPPHCQFTISDKLKFYEGSLILLGIKFVLHQRGQITVPFEKLHSSKSDEKNAQAGGNENDDLYTEIPVEITDPLKRLLFLKQHKLNMLQEKKTLKRSLAEIRNEFTARTSLEPTFQTVVDLLSSLSRLRDNNDSSNIAFALLFGSTVYSCKEVIVFSSIDPRLCDQFTNSPLNDEEELNKTKAAKLFYKSIIMSEHFGNFVSKRLRPCKSYLNLMTQKQLPEDIILKHRLCLLEKFTLPQPLEMKNEKRPFNYRLRSQPNIFHIDFKIVDSNSHTLNYNDLSGYHNYGIPMTFKGMRKICSKF